MSGAADTADGLRVAVSDGKAAALQALLHPDVRLMALGKTLEGAAAVLHELLGDDARAAWSALQWRAAIAVGDAWRLVGERASGTRDRGLVVTLALRDGLVHTLQLQRVPPPPPPATKLRLPAEIRQAIDSALVGKRPMLLAHVGPDGQPVQSFRGSTQVFADDQLAMWVRNPYGDFIRAITLNPRVALMLRNEEQRSTYQFQGRARVCSDEAVHQQVFARSPQAERAHDFAMLGVAVLIDLDRVEGWAGVGPHGQIGQVNMRRDV